MAKRRSKSSPPRPPWNQRRTRVSFVEMMSLANRRAHEHANRRGSRRDGRSVRAAIAAAAPEDDLDAVGLARRLLRWLLALALTPVTLVTLWTLLVRFSDATLHQGFWQTAEFWHFAIGVMVMVGWFCSGLGKDFFLYVYVLGHEVTHAVFVYLCLGWVTGFKVSVDGGYITTTKTNMMIALSPYFVPIWSVATVLIYLVLRLALDFSAEWDKAFYAVIGLTWTFNLVWTFWMLPKDQPDLRENGRVLSLVVICLGNLLVLVAMLCVAGPGSVLEHFRDFGLEWLRHAATWTDVVLRHGNEWIEQVRQEWLFP